MKKINLVFSVLVLLLVLAGCDNNPAEVKEKDPDGVLGGEGEEITYPIEVPFEEYSLDGSECKWVNLDLVEYYNILEPNDGKLLIINNDEELAKYIECTGGGNYPEIDFEKKTLVVGRGVTTSDVQELDIDFLQETSDEYTLNMTITMFMNAHPGAWMKSVIVPKMDNKTKITANITYIPDIVGD